MGNPYFGATKANRWIDFPSKALEQDLRRTQESKKTKVCDVACSYDSRQLGGHIDTVSIYPLSVPII